MTEIYRKNRYFATEAQVQAALTAYGDFYQSPPLGAAPPRLDAHLIKIWNGGNVLDWEWNDETQQEYDRRIAVEAAEAAELALLQSDNEYFKNKKIRPWRNSKLVEWIDITYIRPLLYALTSEQETERINKRQELLNWPGVTDFESYKTDAEIDALKPSAPSWIS